MPFTSGFTSTLEQGWNYLLQNWSQVAAGSLVSVVITTIVAVIVSFALMGYQGTNKGRRYFNTAILADAVILSTIALALAGLPAAVGTTLGVFLVIISVHLAMALGL